MFSLRSCCFAIIQQRFYGHQGNVKEKYSRVAEQSLQRSGQALEKPPIKIENGILPYMPEPDSADYQEWLKLFEKAVEVIAQAAKGPVQE